MSKGCDECEDEETLEALHGTVAGSGGPDELSALLLEMSALAFRAAVLLAEADDEDWKSIGGRLHAFMNVVQQFPSGPRPRRRVGFRTEAVKPKRKTNTKKRGKK